MSENSSSTNNKYNFLSPVPSRTAKPDTTILGCDSIIVEEFIQLFVSRYDAVDKANYFLERRAGISGTSIGMANIRDAISHFVTLFLRPHLSTEEKYAQLANAEEHLRRAIIEPYDLAVADKLEKTTIKISHYETTVFPLIHDPLLSDAPSNVQIQACIKEVQQLMSTGRDAKKENAWSAAWEDGVRRYIDAYTSLEELASQLDTYIGRAAQIKESWTNKIRNNVGILIGFIGVILTIISFI